MSKHELSKKEELALSTCISFIRAHDRVNSRLSARFTRSSLTLSQWSVMEALFQNGPMKGRDIARKLLKSDGNITYVMDNLEKKGLIVRKRSKKDRRRLEVTLSQKGEELFSSQRSEHIELISRLFNCLSAEEQNTLNTITTKLEESLE